LYAVGNVIFFVIPQPVVIFCLIPKLPFSLLTIPVVASVVVLVLSLLAYSTFINTPALPLTGEGASLML